jgi:putative tricarboxylic transport membrane protein
VVNRSQVGADIALAIFLLAVAAVVGWGARSIAPPLYDPLGSAALPLAGCAILTVIAIHLLVGALRSLPVAAPTPAPAAPPRYRLALALVLLVLGYVGAMSSGVAGFRWATLAFLVASGFLLAAGRARSLALPIIAVALVIAFGGYALFTRLFFIDLP